MLMFIFIMGTFFVSYFFIRLIDFLLCLRLLNCL